MNEILGLMKKDWALMKKQMRLMAVYLVVLFGLFSAAADGTLFLSSFFSVLLFLMATNCFAYDEQSNFGKLLAASPVPPGRIVLSRYLLTLLVGAAGSAALALLNLLFARLFDRDIFRPENVLAAFLTSMALALLMVSILFPLFYKFGVNKSRLMILLVCAIPIAAVALLKFLVPETVWQGLTMPPFLLTALPYLLALFLLLCLAASIRISIGILRRTEY